MSTPVSRQMLDIWISQQWRDAQGIVEAFEAVQKLLNEGYEVPLSVFMDKMTRARQLAGRVNRSTADYIRHIDRVGLDVPEGEHECYR